jgi:hypothetical protein
MSKPITITFQASEGLHAWLEDQAGQREMTLGGFVRLTCAEARAVSPRSRTPAPVTTGAGDVFNPPTYTTSPGRLMTVTQAKRLAKGKASR